MKTLRDTLLAGTIFVGGFLAIGGGFMAGHAFGLERGAPDIAGTKVPISLSCQEDETIFWTGIDTLGCVHADSIK